MYSSSPNSTTNQHISRSLRQTNKETDVTRSSARMPAHRSRRAAEGSARRHSSREGLGTLPGFPFRSRRGAEGSARRHSSREGLGTLPGFPFRSRRGAEGSARRHSSREGL